MRTGGNLSGVDSAWLEVAAKLAWSWTMITFCSKLLWCPGQVVTLISDKHARRNSLCSTSSHSRVPPGEGGLGVSKIKTNLNVNTCMFYESNACSFSRGFSADLSLSLLTNSQTMMAKMKALSMWLSVLPMSWNWIWIVWGASQGIHIPTTKGGLKIAIWQIYSV